VRLPSKTFMASSRPVDGARDILEAVGVVAPDDVPCRCFLASSMPGRRGRSSTPPPVMPGPMLTGLTSSLMFRNMTCPYPFAERLEVMAMLLAVIEQHAGVGKLGHRADRVLVGDIGQVVLVGASRYEMMT